MYPSQPQLLYFSLSSQEQLQSGNVAEWTAPRVGSCMVAERKPRARPAGGGGRMRSVEGGKVQGRRAQPPAAPGQGHFTAGLAALFLCLTALLVLLPLVLPPLPPPPLLLLVVPVGLMAVLLALALVPCDGRGTADDASSCLH